MRAIISSKYGGPEALTLEDVEKPTMNENQVLVKVHAASVNYSNLVLLRGKPYLARLAFGVTKPKHSIPGGDVAGVVEAVGEKVKQFQVGDEVYGDLSSSGWGAYADYVAVPEEAIALRPRNLSITEAAAVPMAATTALQAIRDKGHVKPNQNVLLHGASGGVGTFAIQIAKALGAKVTAVVSTRNVENARALGADHVIDYKKERIAHLDKRFDVILGINGSQSILTYNRILAPGGIFVHVGGSNMSQMLETIALGPFMSMTNKKKFYPFMQQPRQKDLKYLTELIEAGKVKPVIDKNFPLHDAPEALKSFEEGHSQGKIVITME